MVKVKYELTFFSFVLYIVNTMTFAFPFLNRF